MLLKDLSHCPSIFQDVYQVWNPLLLEVLLYYRFYLLSSILYMVEECLQGSTQANSMYIHSLTTHGGSKVGWGMYTAGNTLFQVHFFVF